MTEREYFTDRTGARLSLGDRVAAVSHDHAGVPAAVDLGEVVGFGRTNVRVQWFAYAYGAEYKPHSVPGRCIQKVAPDFRRRMSPQPQSTFNDLKDLLP